MLLEFRVRNYRSIRDEQVLSLGASNDQELAATHGWLRAKANSIEGGTSEVNLNVVSKRVLGLPDPK